VQVIAEQRRPEAADEDVAFEARVNERARGYSTRCEGEPLRGSEKVKRKERGRCSSQMTPIGLREQKGRRVDGEQVVSTRCAESAVDEMAGVLAPVRSCGRREGQCGSLEKNP